MYSAFFILLLSPLGWGGSSAEWVWTVGAQVLGLLISNCVTLGYLLNLFVTQFPLRMNWIHIDAWENVRYTEKIQLLSLLASLLTTSWIKYIFLQGTHSGEVYLSGCQLRDNVRFETLWHFFHSHGRLYFSKDNCSNKSHFAGSSVMWPVTSPSAGGVSLPMNLGGLLAPLAERWGLTVWVTTGDPASASFTGSLAFGSLRRPRCEEAKPHRGASGGAHQLSPGAWHGSPRGVQPPAFLAPSSFKPSAPRSQTLGAESTQPLCALSKFPIYTIRDHIKNVVLSCCTSR